MARIKEDNNRMAGRSKAPAATQARRLSTVAQAELDRILPAAADVGICERYYKCNGEQICELMAMCVGLKSADERTLGDALVEPYASMKFRKKVNPTQKHLSEEVKRRALNSMDPSMSPQCTYWTKEKLQVWLTDNPVSEMVDMNFLIAEEKKLCETV
jgi:hypothetical protein